METRVALIAGAGRFPFHVAQEARRHGTEVVAIGLEGWVDCSLAQGVSAYEEVAVGQLTRLIERLKAHGIHRAIMAGKVTKDVLFDQALTFDQETVAILGRVKDFSVTSLLGAIADRLATDGITLLDSSTFLHDSVCPIGVQTARLPTPAEQLDLHVGLGVARQLTALDVGQTVLVKGRVVVAVEALEGTDACVRRAHALSGHGLVMVKAAGPGYDRRFDLPVIGRETATLLASCGVTCVAVESGATLLLDKEALLTTLNTAGICLTGVTLGTS